MSPIAQGHSRRQIEHPRGRRQRTIALLDTDGTGKGAKTAGGQLLGTKPLRKLVAMSSKQNQRSYGDAGGDGDGGPAGREKLGAGVLSGRARVRQERRISAGIARSRLATGSAHSKFGPSASRLRGSPSATLAQSLSDAFNSLLEGNGVEQPSLVPRLSSPGRLSNPATFLPASPGLTSAPKTPLPSLPLAMHIRNTS